MKITLFIFISISFCLNQTVTAQFGTDDVKTIEYLCTIDSSYQKALYYLPDIDGPTPLLVALHSWSSDYTNQNYIHYAEYCIANDWAFIHPDFRGKNNNPDATGSDKVVQDIVDAAAFARNNSLIDTNRIYLAGASGGGHAALLTAAKHPEIWAGVSAWVPMTDLVQWYVETRDRELKYWQDIYNSCGGDPTSDSSAYYEAWRRSPINYLQNAREVVIDINAGINDGHGSFSVPISHSLLAFNELAEEKDTLTHEDVTYFTDNAAVPDHLKNETGVDTLFGEKLVLFRRQSGNARVTIFDGDHEILYHAACEWLSRQVKDNATHANFEIDSMVPAMVLLKQNYPNPFNQATNIEIALNKSSDVKIVVYDVLGRELETLVNRVMPAGIHYYKFDAANYSSGIYYYSLYFGNGSSNQVRTKKMLLLK